MTAKKSRDEANMDYRDLFTALPENYIIFAADSPDFTIVDVNRSQAKLTMTTPRKVIGKSLLEAFPDVSEKYQKTGVSDLVESLKKVVTIRKPVSLGVMRYDIKTPDGTFVERYWRTEHIPILDEYGNVAFILQSSTNITEEIVSEQRLQQIERQLSDALAIGHVGSWAWDIDKNVVYGDRMFAELFGIEPEEGKLGLAFAAFTSTIHPDDRDHVIGNMHKSMQNGGMFNDEYRTFGSDGTIHWVLARGRMTKDTEGNPHNLSGVIVDITERKRAEEAFKEQSAFISTITRSIGDAVYATDEDNNITFINDAAQRMLGYRSREVIGKNVHELVHYRRAHNGKSDSNKPCAIHGHILDKKTVTTEDQFIGKGRNVFPVSYTAAPIIDEEGNVTGGVVAFSDITELKRNQDILRYQSLIVDSINDAIVTINLNGTVTGWNSGAKKLFGLSEKEVIGKKSEDILRLNDKYDRIHIRQMALKRGLWRGNLSYIIQGMPEEVYVSASVSALKNADGEPIGYVMVAQDVSAINRAKSDAAAAEVRARASREQASLLQKKNEELLQLNRTKDEFIALASHQLRTPATGVKQYLGMVLQGFAEPLSPGQQNFLERAYECNERQLRIVEDILRVAQVDLDKIKLHKESVEICALVRDIVESQSGQFKSRNQKIKLQLPDKPIYCTIDSDRLRMAIDNIVDNASKYTYPDKTITIRVGKTPSGKCTISVRDQGVGIRAEDMPQLFQKFSRLENPLSIEVGGNGLGLYWSKKIIEMHDGTIRVSSQPDKGTNFTISIPTSLPSPTKASAPRDKTKQTV